jgi:hypothetical protein
VGRRNVDGGLLVTLAVIGRDRATTPTQLGRVEGDQPTNRRQPTTNLCHRRHVPLAFLVACPLVGEDEIDRTLSEGR